MCPERKLLVISVVVATRNRSRSLAMLLEALENQTMARGEFEIIVVDDASSDPTPEIVESHREQAQGPLRLLRQADSRGPAAARNAGIVAARAPIVAFTDDDCQPERGWLEAGVSAMAAGAGVVMGATSAAGGGDDSRVPFSRTMQVDREDGRYPTCNVFYRREALERVGGFDESFRYACGEDTDLAWRVKGLGYASAFAPDARVVHEVRPRDFIRFLRERRRFADQILLVRRHPHLRSLFYRRYFYRRSHLHVVVTCLLLVAALALSWRWLLLVPAVWLERLWRSDFTRANETRGGLAAQLVIADVWEFIVFCYWSARYRTLLL